MSNIKVYRNFILSDKLYGQNLTIYLSDQGLWYKHDEVLNATRDHFGSLPCWRKYMSYTKSKGVPQSCEIFMRRIS